LRLSGFYSFYDLSDGNLGNDLQIRLGKQFFKDGMFGYEYYFSDWKFISQFYYSPQDFSSHSIWSEWYWSLEKELFGKLGGKIGYVPDVDFVIGEAFFEVNLKPVKALNLLGRIGYTSSYRYTYAYNSFTASVSAYWSLY
jgi:hypothetical protein